MKRIILIIFFCSNAYPQLFSVGVEGGTPLSESTSSGMVGNRSIGGGLSTLNVRRYTVGPTFEVALPFRLRIEADACISAWTGPSITSWDRPMER
jgi:hypothetical protein